MPGPQTLRRASTALLAAAIGATTGGVPGVAAHPPGDFSLPTDSDRAADSRRTVDDSLLPQLDVIDAGGAGEAAQAQLERFNGSDWDIEELAASLGPDPEAAFAFVRDHVAFDPYPGVLRGAHGTLVARAGNAWDRALLLQALLEAGGHSATLVRGELDDTAVAAVLARSLDGAVTPLDDPAPAEVLGLDLAQLENRARRDYALVTEGLGPELAALGAADQPGRQAAFVRDHTWVRLEDDGTPVDLDPTLPETVVGETLAADSVAVGAIPDEQLARLDVRIVVERLADGVLDEETLLEQSLVAADAAKQEIWLSFQPAASGIGAKLLDAMGDVAWVPTLSNDGEVVTGTEFTLGSSGDVADFFGGGGGEPEVTAVRVDLTSLVPGLEPRTARRVLLDRVDPGLRASGSVTSETLAPLPPSGEVIPALAGMHQILVGTGAADLRTFASARVVALGVGADFLNDSDMSDGLSMSDQLFPLAVSNELLPLASERLFSGNLGSDGAARAFVGRPRAYLVSFEPLPGVPGGTTITTDLALDDIDVVTGEAEDPSLPARIRLWYGVLQTALETELARARSAAVDPATASFGSVSTSMSGPPRLLRPGSDVPEASTSAALADALAGGDLALLVPDSVPTAFWTVEPASGRTRSVEDPGVRVGHVGGGNYVNAATGGPRYVVDPQTGRSLGTISNGKFTPAGRAAPSRCGGGTEYVIVLGCVSIPASMTAGLATGVVITAIVAWATVLLEVLLL